jgi:hypothetical protein
MRHLLILVPAVLFAAGCGDSNGGPVVAHPVSGKVVYDGKPAAGVLVTFIPTDAPGIPRIPRNPHAVTAADGTFALTTFKEGDGAAEGGYQVVLSWPISPDMEGPDEARDADRLLGWYDPLHSTVNFRVKAGTNEVPTFNIPKITQHPPVSQGVPGRN